MWGECRECMFSANAHAGEADGLLPTSPSVGYLSSPPPLPLMRWLGSMQDMLAAVVMLQHATQRPPSVGFHAICESLARTLT
jgi:hypothetical protein